MIRDGNTRTMEHSHVRAVGLPDFQVYVRCISMPDVIYVVSRAIDR